MSCVYCDPKSRINIFSISKRLCVSTVSGAHPEDKKQCDKTRRKIEEPFRVEQHPQKNPRRTQSGNDKFCARKLMPIHYRSLE